MLDLGQESRVAAELSRKLLLREPLSLPVLFQQLGEGNHGCLH